MKIYFFIALVSAFLLSCQSKKEAETDLYGKRNSDSLISLTFDTLRNTLMKAINEKGFAEAINFCNEKATGLTNIYASEKIMIRRSSDRYRNPANAPDKTESRILTSFCQILKEKKELNPILEKTVRATFTILSQ